MTPLSSFSKRQSGQVLIESVVSISLVTVGLLGILTLLSNSIAFNRNVTNKFVATYLAAEGIEVIKNIEDTNFTHRDRGDLWNLHLNDGTYEIAYDSAGDLTAATSRPLLFDSSTGVYNYDPSGQPTIFTRTVQITNRPPYELIVTSTVQWVDKGKPEQVELEDHFFNWR